MNLTLHIYFRHS